MSWALIATSLKMPIRPTYAHTRLSHDAMIVMPGVIEILSQGKEDVSFIIFTLAHWSQRWASGASSSLMIVKQTACCQNLQFSQLIIRPSSWKVVKWRQLMGVNHEFLKTIDCYNFELLWWHNIKVYILERKWVAESIFGIKFYRIYWFFWETTKKNQNKTKQTK